VRARQDFDMDNARSAQLTLHIGPPKTASTSLQLALQDSSHHDFAYGGCYQPRGSRGEALSDGLHDIAAGRVRTNGNQIDTLNCIRDSLATGLPLVISEEMFLVQQPGANMREKIARLGQALHGIPTRILITLRRPSEALPSLYQELYLTLPRPLRHSFDAFCESEAAFCFDYEAIESLLKTAGFAPVSYLRFDSLASGQVPLSSILGPSATCGGNLKIMPSNTGKFGRQPNLRRLPRVSLRTAAATSAAKDVFFAGPEKARRGLRTLLDAADRITLAPEREGAFVVRQDIADRLDRAFEARMTQH
jgi:hypothetical protein